MGDAKVISVDLLGLMDETPPVSIPNPISLAQNITKDVSFCGSRAVSSAPNKSAMHIPLDDIFMRNANNHKLVGNSIDKPQGAANMGHNCQVANDSWESWLRSNAFNSDQSTTQLQHGKGKSAVELLSEIFGDQCSEKGATGNIAIPFTSTALTARSSKHAENTDIFEDCLEPERSDAVSPRCSSRSANSVLVDLLTPDVPASQPMRSHAAARDTSPGARFSPSRIASVEQGRPWPLSSSICDSPAPQVMSWPQTGRPPTPPRWPAVEPAPSCDYPLAKSNCGGGLPGSASGPGGVPLGERFFGLGPAEESPTAAAAAGLGASAQRAAWREALPAPRALFHSTPTKPDRFGDLIRPADGPKASTPSSAGTSGGDAAAASSSGSSGMGEGESGAVEAPSGHPRVLLVVALVAAVAAALCAVYVPYRATVMGGGEAAAAISSVSSLAGAAAAAESALVLAAAAGRAVIADLGVWLRS